MRKTIMIIYDEMKKLYAACPERSLASDLQYYMQHGYIFIGPSYCLIGARVGDGWHIHLAIGEDYMRKFAELMPYYLPFIGWAREGRRKADVVWYPAERVFRRIGWEMTFEQMDQRDKWAHKSLIAQYNS